MYPFYVCLPAMSANIYWRTSFTFDIFPHMKYMGHISIFPHISGKIIHCIHKAFAFKVLNLRSLAWQLLAVQCISWREWVRQQDRLKRNYRWNYFSLLFLGKMSFFSEHYSLSEKKGGSTPWGAIFQTSQWKQKPYYNVTGLGFIWRSSVKILLL